MYHHWHAFPVSFSLSPKTPCQLEYRHFVCFFSAFFSMLLCIIGSLVNWAYEEMSPLSHSWICEPLQMVKSQILLLVIVTSHFQLHDPIISARSFTIILSLKPHQEFLTQDFCYYQPLLVEIYSVADLYQFAFWLVSQDVTDETALLLMSVWGCGFIKMPRRNWLFATCHHNCDPLSLLGPIGPFCYLWSTFASTSTLVGKFSSLHDRSWWDWCSW